MNSQTKNKGGRRLVTNKDIKVVNLAIIGCGAVTELCHLPALKFTSGVKITTLVDKNPQRTKFLGERFGIEHCLEDYHNLDGIDGVIIALPHFLHAPVAIEFLQRGIPVLVEKPMALNLDEAKAMVKIAKDNNVPLQVGLHYHFCKGALLIKEAINEGWLGKLQSFTVEWCFVYDWPVASGFFFSRHQAGGGVLIDLGSHVLDLLLWWFGDAESVTYRDDADGGVEAECDISLVLQGRTGRVPGKVILSRQRKLPYSAQVVGTNFTIECDISSPVSARIWPTKWSGTQRWFDDHQSQPQSLEQAYAAQLDAFAKAIKTKKEPVVSGESVLASLALIDRCYSQRQPLDMPWNRATVVRAKKEKIF